VPLTVPAFVSAVSALLALGVGAPLIALLLVLFAGLIKGVLLMRRWRADMTALATLSTELESRVEQRSRELEQALRALFRTERLAAVGRLASGVAHEINNPAAVVLGNLEYVLECRARGGSLPEDAGDALGEAREGVRRIADIVRKLLAGTKAARQDDAKAFSVGEAVGAAADRLRAGSRPEVELVVDLPADLSARGSVALLEQVLVDLALNGIQAIPQGRAGRVRIWAAKEADKVLVRVSDDGRGMDERTVAGLFEPFFSTKPVGQGAGLSLPVSLALLRSIGGDLRIDSEPGRGTTATVVLEAASSSDRAAA
jgi:two-component system NtrC family sensor kinase